MQTFKIKAVTDFSFSLVNSIVKLMVVNGRYDVKRWHIASLLFFVMHAL